MAILEAMLPPNGGDRKSDQKQNFVSDRHDAAKKAGFGNYETARQAKTVTANGSRVTVLSVTPCSEAMDSAVEADRTFCPVCECWLAALTV